MAMTKKQKDRLKESINAENILVKRLGKWIKFSLLVCGLAIALSYWGFSGMKDAFLPNISDSLRDIIKWIAVGISVLSSIFAIMCFFSFRNGKKHVLSMINELGNL